MVKYAIVEMVLDWSHSNPPLQILTAKPLTSKWEKMNGAQDKDPFSQWCDHNIDNAIYIISSFTCLVCPSILPPTTNQLWGHVWKSDVKQIWTMNSTYLYWMSEFFFSLCLLHCLYKTVTFSKTGKFPLRGDHVLRQSYKAGKWTLSVQCMWDTEWNSNTLPFGSKMLIIQTHNEHRQHIIPLS